MPAVEAIERSGGEFGSALHRAIYLTGPTASGKTGVGVQLALRLDAEIIALDSMTLYRGMDIGTAKPTLEERQGVPHHLIDVLDPWQSASVADYRAWAAQAATEIERRGKRVLFVGGTALYLKTLLRGLFEAPAVAPEVRRGLELRLKQEGSESLHRALTQVDPASAGRLHPRDSRRVIRALEVFEATGRPISEWQVEHQQPGPSSARVFALERPRAEVHDRINRRVVQMFQDGLIDEVRQLQAGPHPIGPVPAQGVGYLEVIELLEGRLSEPLALERIQARTRQFAKRQSTWFRGLSEVESIAVESGETAVQVADRLAGEFGDSPK